MKIAPWARACSCILYRATRMVVFEINIFGAISTQPRYRLA